MDIVETKVFRTCMAAAAGTGLDPQDAEILGRTCVRTILDESSEGTYRGWWTPKPEQVLAWLDANREELAAGGEPVPLMDFAEQAAFDMTGDAIKGIRRSLRACFADDVLREKVDAVLSACLDEEVVTVNVSLDNSVSYVVRLDASGLTIPVRGTLDDLWTFIRHGTEIRADDVSDFPVDGRISLIDAVPVGVEWPDHLNSSRALPLGRRESGARPGM